jgi:hypothetical protein
MGPVLVVYLALKGKDLSAGVGTGGTVILKWVIKKQGEKV